MKKLLFTFLMAIICCTFLTNIASAQINMPQPSPSATLTQKVGLTDVTISYSRPSMKGRKIFGTLLPYNELWRTGANGATTFTFSDEITLEGKKIPAGTYSLFSIPTQNEWTVILNKNPKASMGDYKQEDDLVRYTIAPKKTATPYETLTIDLSDLTPTSAFINIKWENTKIALKLESEVDSKVMAQIKEKMATAKDTDTDLYFQSALYYMESGKDLKQAMEWMTKATATDPKFWQLHQKAKLQAKLKDNKGAIESAKKSIELAKVAKDNNYVRMNEDLIAQLQKAK